MIAFKSCYSYHLSELQRAMDLLPWPSMKGKSIFIKPNLVTPPIEQDRQSVTHPRFIEAVLTRVRDAGAASIIVGCCGFKGQWERTVSLMGLDDICSRYEAELICVQEGDNYHKYTLQRLDQYMSLFGTKVSDYVLNSDMVINLPKMKVHSMAGMTGAIKNMMGVISPKGSMHPHGSSDILHKRLADLYQLMRNIVSWTVMDGIIGAEFSEQYGVARKANSILAGDDMWEVDCVASRIMGIPPESIRYLKYIQTQRDEDFPTLPPGAVAVPFERPLCMRSHA